jgi:hypothetical protein
MRGVSLVLAAAAFLAACGSRRRRSREAKTAYINRVDAICAQTNGEMRETNARLNELVRSAKDVSEFQDELGDGQFEARDELARIRSVPAPAGASAAVKEIVAARDRQLDLVDRLIAASKRNDASAFQHISDEVAGARKTVQGLADRFGLRICGQDPGPAGR